MSEFKGTPGPWKTTSFSFAGDTLYSVIQDSDEPAGGIFLGTVASHVPGAKANSDLIAAAPDLLDSLQRIMNRRYPDWLLGHDEACSWHGGDDCDCGGDQARTAIKKALGEQQ